MEKNHKEIATVFNKYKNYILDVDYDFFYNTELDLRDSFFKKKKQKQLFHNFLKNFKNIKFNSVMSHEEALSIWHKNNLRNQLCIHIDYHHDLYMKPSELNRISLTHLDETLNCANYLSVALKAGIIETIIWVYPDNLKEVDEIELPFFFNKLGIKVFSISYRLFMENFFSALKLKNCLAPIICLSPDFIPISDYALFFKFFKCEEEFKFKVMEFAYEEIFSNKKKVQNRFISLNLDKFMKFGFYSPNENNFKIIKNDNGFNKKNIFSSSILFSYIFSEFNKNNIIKGVDFLINQHPIYYIFFKSKYKDNDKYRTIYIIKNNFLFKQNSETFIGFDYFTKNNLKNHVQNKINLDLRNLKNNEILVLEKNQKLDISKSINWKALKSNFTIWMSMNEDILMLMRSTFFWFEIYLDINNIRSNNFLPLIFWNRFALKILFPKIIKTNPNFDDQYQNLSHGLDIGLIALVIGCFQKTFRLPSFIAGLSNNLIEKNKKKCFVKNLFTNEWKDYSSQFNNEIINAITPYSENYNSKNNLSKILNDAEMVKLSWKKGYERKQFTTNIGREIANCGPEFYNFLETHLFFKKNVYMELSFNNNFYIITMWHLGVRYFIEKTNIISANKLNSIMSQFNIKYLFIFNNTFLNRTSFVKNIFNDVTIIFENKVMFNKFSKFINAEILNYNKIFLSETDSLKNNIFIKKNTKYFLNVNKKNMELICESLNFIAENNIILFFEFNSNDNDYKNLNQIIFRLFNEKSKNEYFSSIKIVSNAPWCLVKDPWVANNVFEKSSDAYFFEIINKKYFTKKSITYEILKNVRRKFSVCGGCPFLVNCQYYPKSSKINNFMPYMKKYKDFKSLHFNYDNL